MGARSAGKVQLALKLERRDDAITHACLSRLTKYLLAVTNFCCSGGFGGCEYTLISQTK